MSLSRSGTVPDFPTVVKQESYQFQDKSRTVNSATGSDDDNWRKKRRINISLQHWMFLANARNGNSAQ